MKEITVKVHDVATDGLPDMAGLAGRVVFLFDGGAMSGWPLDPVGIERETGRRPGGVKAGDWEGSCGRETGTFRGVTHWLEFPAPLSRVEGRA